MGFFTSYSWRKSIVLAVVAALVTGLGFAVRYGEDNQVGSSNEVSWWVFVVAGLFAYWSVLGFVLSLFKALSRRRENTRNGNSAHALIDADTTSHFTTRTSVGNTQNSDGDTAVVCTSRKRCADSATVPKSQTDAGGMSGGTNPETIASL